MNEIGEVDVPRVLRTRKDLKKYVNYDALRKLTENYKNLDLFVYNNDELYEGIINDIARKTMIDFSSTQKSTEDEDYNLIYKMANIFRERRDFCVHDLVFMEVIVKLYNKKYDDKMEVFKGTTFKLYIEKYFCHFHLVIFSLMEQSTLISGDYLTIMRKMRNNKKMLYVNLENGNLYSISKRLQNDRNVLNTILNFCIRNRCMVNIYDFEKILHESNVFLVKYLDLKMSIGTTNNRQPFIPDYYGIKNNMKTLYYLIGGRNFKTAFRGSLCNILSEQILNRPSVYKLFRNHIFSRDALPSQYKVRVVEESGKVIYRMDEGYVDGRIVCYDRKIHQREYHL